MTAETSVAPRELNGLSILLVEDDPTALATLKQYFTRYGATVLTADNGRAGFEMFEEKRPQLVISDIRMPGEDGISMVTAIRKIDPDVGVIIVSAHNEPQVLLQSIDVGVTKYLVKPVDLGALRAAVLSVAGVLAKRRSLEARLRDMSSVISQAEYDAEKIQSYINRSMGTEQIRQIDAVRYRFVPKGEVSGDFFCVEQFGDTLYVLVADGSGHGLSAILPALQVPRLFRTQARQGYSLLTIADAINRSLNEQKLAEHFVAATLLRMNYREGYIEVMNCGNPPVLLVDRNGAIIEHFPTRGAPLGMVDADHFNADVDHLNFSEPATLLLTTDGLIDSLGRGQGITFALDAYLQAQAGKEPFVALSTLLDELPQDAHLDDITLLEVRFQPGETKSRSGRRRGRALVGPASTVAPVVDFDTRLKQMTLLFVEDDPDAFEHLSDYLSARVGELHRATNGEEGLRLFEAYQPDLVVADVRMPLKDGRTLLEAIRDLDPDVPVVMMGDGVETEHIESMVDLRANKFLTKPIDVERLKSAINDSIQQFNAVFGIKLSASVFMTSPLAITIAGRNREILAVNPAFCRITGYSQEEVIGHNPRILSSGKHDAAFYQTMWDSIHETGAWSGEIWNRRKSGELFLEWITINAVKGDDNELAHYVAVFSDITERNAAEAKIRHLAQHDSLTNLPNRVLFMDRVQQALLLARREKETLAIMFLDIDHFKTINDTMGHGAGDNLLCAIAQDLSGAVRSTDTVSRLGGDEFAILLPKTGARDMIGRIAGKLIALINRARTIQNQTLQVGVSIGISVYPADGSDAETLIKHADSAMYHSKRSGRNHFRFYESHHEAQDKRLLAIQQGMRAGLHNGEFSLVYQPKYSVSQRAVVGAEALLRWHSPSLGVVSPAEFIPIAEETGFIVDIGEWVIHAVARQLAAWRAADAWHGPVAINISPLHFQRGNVIASLLDAINTYRLGADALLIELTEGVVMKDSEAILSNLLELKELGIKVSIDDFGTGYSSLSYLKRLPIDELKIDRSFISVIDGDTPLADKAATAIPLAIIQLANNLGMTLVAEGVETAQQRQFMADNGCDVIQGYLVSRPVPPDEFLQRVAALCEPVLTDAES